MLLEKEEEILSKGYIRFNETPLNFRDALKTQYEIYTGNTSSIRQILIHRIGNPPYQYIVYYLTTSNSEKVLRNDLRLVQKISEL